MSAISIEVINNFAFAMAVTSGVMVSVLIAALLQNQNEIGRYEDPTDDYFPYLERQVGFIRLSIMLGLTLLVLSILTPLVMPLLDLKPIVFAGILLIPFGGLVVALSFTVLRDFL